LYLLPTKQYNSARPILQALNIHLVIDAVLGGRTEGQVYVDDPGQPRAALARRKHRHYLAVEEPNAGAALLQHWSEVLYPQARAAGHQMYVLYCASDRWTPLIEETLADLGPIPAPRQYYAISTSAQREPPPLPAGYKIHAVDQELLLEGNLLHLAEVRDEIESEHATPEAFLRESFGVCAIHERHEIAGWCLAEYNNAERAEVGIETWPEHQRRGLGTAMTVALVAQARARGLSHVGWHSYSRNVASIATARKAGLEKACDYPAYIGYYDPVYHLSERGYTAVGEGHTEEGLAWLQTAFARGTAPGWAYYSAGCACVALGQHDQAFRYLGQAIEQGFVERTLYEGDEKLRALHGMARWVELLDRLGQPGSTE
jgi:GNAT superfamily N-acetyltransferase